MSGYPRVLFVTHNIPRAPGDAAGSFVLRLAVALQQAGARVDVIAPGATDLPDTACLEGVNIRRVRYARNERMTLAYGGTMAEAVKGSWGARVAFLQLLRALRRATRDTVTAAARTGDPYQVVHAHWWFPSGLALWRHATPDFPPLVITMHGSDVRLAERMTVAHPLMRAVLRQAAVCTVVSSWLAEMVRRVAPGQPVTVSPMPVDVTRFAAPVAAGATARAGVLFVGRLNAQKGVADLLEAFARPPLQEPAHASVLLHLVGDGPDRTRLMALADRLGVASRVRWHGALPQDALGAHYRAAQVVAIPSRGEGLGLVAVEAQLCGTPVVAYADAGLRDVVRPEHGGVAVPVGDIEALAQALADVLGDRAPSTRGDIAREDMLERFSPERVAARYLVHYAEAQRA